MYLSSHYSRLLSQKTTLIVIATIKLSINQQGEAFNKFKMLFTAIIAAVLVTLTIASPIYPMHSMQTMEPRYHSARGEYSIL